MTPKKWFIRRRKRCWNLKIELKVKVMFLAAEPVAPGIMECMSRFGQVLATPTPEVGISRNPSVILHGILARLASVAQRIELLTSDQKVGGSSPSGRTFLGNLAFLSRLP